MANTWTWSDNRVQGDQVSWSWHQSFLGFTNFYHHFIFNYSDIVVPLTRLTWKDAPWDFSDVCQQSFNQLKTAFTTAPILTHFQPGAQLTVKTNALDYAEKITKCLGGCSLRWGAFDPGASGGLARLPRTKETRKLESGRVVQSLHDWAQRYTLKREFFA